MFRHKTARKFLISIGAGTHQIPLISAAKKEGFSVIGVDINPSAPGLPLCDLKIHQSILEKDDIYHKIRECMVDGVIIGALTRSFGEAVRTAAYINEKSGIPYIPLNRIDELLDKKKMKNTLVKAGIITPVSKIFDPKKDAKDFPFILKPAKGHAKKGVRLIRNSHDLEKYFAEFPAETGRQDMKEAYIDGDEIIAAGITRNGKFTLIEVTDKVITNPPLFIDLRHTSPSRHYDRWDEIELCGQSAADAFGIQCSPVLLEIRFDRDDRLNVIEVIPDFGGEYITDILIPAASGYPFMSNCIRAIAGEKIHSPYRRKKRCSVVIQYLTAGNGYLASYSPLNASLHKNLIAYKVFSKIGSDVKKPENNHDRIGVVITQGKKMDIAMSASQAAVQALALTVKSSKKQQS